MALPGSQDTIFMQTADSEIMVLDHLITFSSIKRVEK